jgi:hypothetical protein
MRIKIATAAALLVACSGKPEADQMTKYADQMCACKDIKCAEKLFPELEKWTGENENKEVNQGAAERYNTQLARTQKCYDALTAAPAK